MLPESLRAIQDRCRVVTAAAWASHDAGPRLHTGWPGIDAALGAGMPTGLHEWFAISPYPGDARGLSPFCLLIHLAWRLLEQSHQPRWIVWIHDGPIPYPTSFRRGDANDARLLRRTLFVSARDGPARQWAADAALRCRAVHAVITAGAGFDRAATRRLHLLSRSQAKWIWLTRPPSEQDTLSAAFTRWAVCWNSDVPDGSVGVRPGWRLTLLRCKGVPIETTPEWILEWNHATGALNLSAELAGVSGDAASRPQLSQRPRQRIA